MDLLTLDFFPNLGINSSLGLAQTHLDSSCRFQRDRAIQWATFGTSLQPSSLKLQSLLSSRGHFLSPSHQPPSTSLVALPLRAFILLCQTPPSSLCAEEQHPTWAAFALPTHLILRGVGRGSFCRALVYMDCWVGFHEPGYRLSFWNLPDLLVASLAVSAGELK